MGKADVGADAKEGRQADKQTDGGTDIRLRQAVLSEKVKWHQELLVRRSEGGALNVRREEGGGVIAYCKGGHQHTHGSATAFGHWSRSHRRTLPCGASQRCPGALAMWTWMGS